MTADRVSRRRMGHLRAGREEPSPEVYAEMRTTMHGFARLCLVCARVRSWQHHITAVM